jgi:hypothetical protein
MIEKISRFTVLAFIVSQCVACAASTNLDYVFKNRNQLVGKVITVKGVLVGKGGVIKICKKERRDRCIDLEYTTANKEQLTAQIGNIITFEGIYKEHTYIETKAGLSFIPSRISVLKLLPNNDAK